MKYKHKALYYLYISVKERMEYTVILLDSARIITCFFPTIINTYVK